MDNWRQGDSSEYALEVFKYIKHALRPVLCWLVDQTETAVKGLKQ
jgi:hypothetical protein